MAKKIISALIVMTMVLSMFSSLGAFAADQVLFSDSFEKDLKNWMLANDLATSNAKVEKGGAADGSYYLFLDDDTSETSPILKSKTISVSGGDIIDFSADFKLVEGKNISVHYKFYDSSNKQLSNGSIGSSDKEWKHVVKTATAPEGASHVQLTVTGTVAGIGKCSVDNIKVVKTGKATGSSQSSSSSSSTSSTGASGDTLFLESFENGMDNWTASNDLAISNITLENEGSDGKKSVLFNDDTDATSPVLVSKAISVSAGDIVTLSADFKLLEGNKVAIYYKIYDSSNKQIGGSSMYAVAGGEWKNVSKSITMPAGAKTVQLTLTGTVAGFGKGYVDNIKMVRTGKADAASTETKEEEKKESKPAPAVTGKLPHIATDSIASGVVFSESFEADKYDWNFSNIVDGNSITVETDTVSDGKKSLLLVDDSSIYSPIAKSPYIDLKEGDNFKISVYIKCVKGNATRVYFKFYDKAGKQLSTGSFQSSGTEWKECSTIVTAPQGAASLQLWLTGVNNSTSSSYFDNIVITKLTAEDVAKAENEALEAEKEREKALGVIDGIPAENDKFHIYLCIGQSNMVGADRVQENDAGIVDGAYLLNSNGKWENAQAQRTADGTYLGYNRYSTVGPNSGQMGPTIGFAKGMVKKVPEGVKIGIISNAKGGTTIEQWSKGFEKTESRADFELYESAVKRTKDALAKGGVLKGIFWFQGESCASKEGYMEKLVKVANGMREELGVKNSDVPFFVTEIPHNRAAGVKVLQTAPQYIENSFVVSSKDLKIFDSIHLDYDSQRKLGLRYAEIALDKIYGIAASADAMYSEIYGAPQEEKVDNTVYTILVNGKKLESDVPPVMAGDRLFVPIRVIFETLGATVSWEEATETVTGVRGDRTVKMQIGDEHMTVNGVTTAMGVAPMLKDSRTLVPIRFVGEGLGATVGWDEKTNTASINLQ